MKQRMNFEPIEMPDGYAEELKVAGQQGSAAGEAMRNMLLDVEHKRNLLVREKLIEKGFEHLLDQLPSKMINTRFPKVVRENLDNGWCRFWAYNGTPEGAFIVSIGPLKYDTKFDYSKLNEGTAGFSTKINFKWNDKDPNFVTTL